MCMGVCTDVFARVVSICPINSRSHLHQNCMVLACLISIYMKYNALKVDHLIMNYISSVM